ncbi:nucleoside-diphosphate-sugar epimerase family protein [Biscogniauxia marginata]|nr:nucleoside-diphosphate-sugar epimerase family protein [Biscogniauxia marginata]
MATRTILVVGATGQQGTAVLEALSEFTSSSSSSSSSTPSIPKIKILALTRSASSPKARALPSTYPGLDLELVEGNTRDPGPIFAAHPDIDAVFSYTTPPDEVPQARALIDAAAASGRVSHFVFSSVDHGGEPKSWDSPTEIPHFREKHEIEVHLRAACGGGGRKDKNKKMTYTILRPVAFMDNLNPTSAFGAAFASLWATMPRDTKLQVVSVRDIGRAAARALLLLQTDAGRSRYADRAAGLQLPQAWTVVGWGVRWAAREVGLMFRWFETDGYGVDIAALRREEPGLQDFETWLRESSRFECGRGRGE